MLHMEECAKTFLAFLHALGISFCAILCALAFFLFFFFSAFLGFLLLLCGDGLLLL